MKISMSNNLAKKVFCQLILVLLFYIIIVPIGSAQTLTLPDCVDCPSSSSGFTIGEVCPFMMDIKDWGRTALYNTTSGAAGIFVTSNGELWGYGHNDINSVLGYPGHLNDDPITTLDMPRIDVIVNPSPLAAVYRQGLTKTWESVVLSPNDAGAFALATDGTLWAWGGSRNALSVTDAWDRPAHAGGVGPNAWTAGQIPAPAPGITFTQVYDHHGRIAWGRGSDGRLYAWGNYTLRTNGQSGPTGVQNVLTPTIADLIPQQILDSKYAVLPSNTGNGGAFIDINGDTWNFGTPITSTTSIADAPVQLMFPTPGVKAVKLTGDKEVSLPQQIGQHMIFRLILIP